MREKRTFSSQRGQVLLVVVLASVIALTVGLSAASRVITNTKTATDDTDAQKALSAAQAGVEQALKNNATSNVTLSNGSSVSYKTTDYTANNVLVNQGNVIERGADIWLSDYPNYTHPRNATLTFYWTGGTQCSDNNVPALEMIILTGTKANPVYTRSAYDPCSTRVSENKFTQAQLLTGSNVVKVSGIDFNRSSGPITVNDGILVRIIPVYAPAKVLVRLSNVSTDTALPAGEPLLPAQGSVIESTGISGNSTKKLKVVQGYPKLPDEYFYSLLLPTK